MSGSASATAVARRQWRSRDGGFGVVVEQRHVERLLRHCHEAGGRETGGILFGRYSDRHDLAIVTGITGPPRDSCAGRAFFVRGTHGLQRVLDLLWRGRSGYYLGEWHLHPAGDGTPSGIDVEQMKKIAQSAAYKCPEPVLLIVTGRLPATWGIRMFIYPAGLQVELEDVSVPGPSAT